MTHQGLQLFVVREVELSDKVIEMLVAGVDVSLGPHLAHAVKVVDVDVDKHPEQTRQNLLSHLHEGLREWSTCESNRWREPRSIQDHLLLCAPKTATHFMFCSDNEMINQVFLRVFICPYFVLWRPSSWKRPSLQTQMEN